MEHIADYVEDFVSGIMFCSAVGLLLKIWFQYVLLIMNYSDPFGTVLYGC